MLLGRPTSIAQHSNQPADLNSDAAAALFNSGTCDTRATNIEAKQTLLSSLLNGSPTGNEETCGLAPPGKLAPFRTHFQTVRLRPYQVRGYSRHHANCYPGSPFWVIVIGMGWRVGWCQPNRSAGGAQFVGRRPARAEVSFSRRWVSIFSRARPRSALGITTGSSMQAMTLTAPPLFATGFDANREHPFHSLRPAHAHPVFGARSITGRGVSAGFPGHAALALSEPLENITSRRTYTPPARLPFPAGNRAHQ